MTTFIPKPARLHIDPLSIFRILVAEDVDNACAIIDMLVETGHDEAHPDQRSALESLAFLYEFLPWAVKSRRYPAEVDEMLAYLKAIPVHPFYQHLTEEPW